MANNFGVTPAGALPYGAEHLQAQARYGMQPYGHIMPGLPSTSVHSLPAVHRAAPKPKARGRYMPASQHEAAQPRQEENHDIGDGLEENCFALVSTAELEQQGLKKHPDKIAEAASLNSVSLPAGKYKLGLPAFIIQGKTPPRDVFTTRTGLARNSNVYSLTSLPSHLLNCCHAGRISALQFQSVRLACQRHETFLPDRTRAGFFLGDGKLLRILWHGRLHVGIFNERRFCIKSLM